MTLKGILLPFPRLTQVANAALSQGVVPGLAIAVGAPHLPALSQSLSFGVRGFGLSPTSADTTYDLASLTKPLCTSVLAMHALAEGRLSLTDPLRRWMPQAPEAVRIDHALTHTTGWPAHHKFYTELLPLAHGYDAYAKPLRDELLERVVTTTPQAPPGTRLLYSDLGFIVLGRVLELVFAQPLAEAFFSRVAQPLGLPQLGFTPRSGAFAPTENCAWRGQLLSGQVHDQNAWLMGGVAGHAGLFGSVQDVAALVASLLRTYAGNALPEDRTPQQALAQFWKYRGSASGTWALGWDRPSEGFSLAGQSISRSAVGHLAFTGCSVWIDPRKQVYVVMLSNRIHPKVQDDPRFRLLRPAIMDAALADMGYVSA